LAKPILIYYKILNFQEDILKYIEENFDSITLPDPGHDTEEVLKKAKVLFAPMGFMFDKNKIDMCSALHVLGTPTTGELHIDVDYARKKNISICSLRNQKEFLSKITPTAELAWGLILCVTRRIPWAHDSVCEGRWEGKEFGNCTPRMLSNMSLGIVGMGRLGSWMAKYGHSFKMDVFYYDPFVTDDRYIKSDNLLDLAKSSDIVSIHVHLSKDTEKLINKSFIGAMKKGSYIINTARGGILDEEALLEALLSGHLAGAGLDMLTGEHLPGFKDTLQEHSLVKYANTHDNLLITPKMGGATIDAWEKTERRIVDLIIEELKERGQ
jgi:D-3-phosphoglycerate dehydrogenase